MKASDIAKLAAGIAAGSLTYDAVVDQLDDDGDISLLDTILASGAGGVTGSIVGGLMDATGVSEVIDEIFDW
jgi:hypothetical protein